MLELLHRLIIVLLPQVDISDHDEDSSIAHVVSTEYLDVHLQTLLEETEGILEVAGFHVALAEQGEDLRMVLLCLLMFLEE